MTIKDRRKKLRMTQAEVANRCGISVRRFRRWENAECEIPAGRLVVLAQVLRFSVDRLLRAWAELDAIDAVEIKS